MINVHESDSDIEDLYSARADAFVRGDAEAILSVPERLLIAQARLEPMIVLTDDKVLGGYGAIIEVV